MKSGKMKRDKKPVEIERDVLIRYVYAKLSEAPELAKKLTEINGQELKYRRVYFRIKKHVTDFLMGEKPGNIENRFLVMPGLRGVGKTTLLFQIYNYLRKENIQENRILYFSADEIKTYLGADIKDIVDVFIREVHNTSVVGLDKKLFILVDEAHYDREWSSVGKILYDQSKEIFMIFTGSSALSLEMNVDAARRSKREMVFPMNFSEYITLKYNIFPPKGMAESLREFIFRPKTFFGYASKNENLMKKNLIKLRKPVDKVFEEFLCVGGFPISLYLSKTDVYERIFDMVSRVIEKDVFSLQSFTSDTRNTIARILAFLALQKPGEVSDMKLSQKLGTSPTMVRNILHILEKTHLIFSVKPYSGAGKIVRKPWKYYFLSPSIHAALMFKIGMFDEKNREILGLLGENFAASSFFRIKETMGMVTGVFYDPEEGGVDFILQKGERLIPVEVGIGKKSKGQIKKAIERYNSPYGIVIHGGEKIEIKGNIVYIPIITFSFL